ncbi:MAG TPA: hypothetical protein VMW43_05515 [Bacteroidota bacterium]|nr:hypothetical protein [Bacteroidota bacterium]
MKLSAVLFFILLSLSPAYAQSPGHDAFTCRHFSSRISFITMDSAHSSQTTVIEYPAYLVLSELPLTDAGAEKSTGLEENLPRAERFIRFIDEQFGGKPVKYIFSSHWHLHSLSAITPFFRRRCSLVTTRKNWRYALNQGFLGASDAAQFAPLVKEVNADTTFFADSDFPIRVLYLDTTYTHKPTEDYLFLYFPVDRILHASCMCPLPDVNLADGKRIYYSDRLTDVQDAITRRRLPVDTLIRLGRSERNSTLLPVFGMNYFEKYMKDGTPLHDVAERYAAMDPERLEVRCGEVLADAVARSIPASALNQAVYQCLRRKDYRRALALGRILLLYAPLDPNYVDTMGEAYYDAGDTTTAAYYDRILKKSDPLFGGGLKSWESNLQR